MLHLNKNLTPLFLSFSGFLNTYIFIKMQWCIRLNKRQSCVPRFLWVSHGILMTFLTTQPMKISTTSEDQMIKLWSRNGLTGSQLGNVSIILLFSNPKWDNLSPCEQHHNYIVIIFRWLSANIQKYAKYILCSHFI